MVEETKMDNENQGKTKTKKVSVKKTDRDFATLTSWNVPISTKQSYEIAKFIKNRKVEQAKKLLKEVIQMKRAVPVVRYNRDTGHKPGIAAGRYYQKASEHMLELLDAVESLKEKNKELKGLLSKLR